MVPEALPRKKDEERIQRRPPQGRRQGRQGIRRKAPPPNRKGRSNLADETDTWQAEGQWQDSQWQDQSWDDWSWKGKGKGKFGKEGKHGKSGSKDGAAQLADAAQSGTTTATTFYVDHMNPLNFSFMATTEEQTSFIAQPLTPTSMVLVLGCTRATASRVAAQDLMKFCGQNSHCGIWY